MPKDDGNGGGSRAAKKRAKKRRQQLEQEQHQQQQQEQQQNKQKRLKHHILVEKEQQQEQEQEQENGELLGCEAAVAVAVHATDSLEACSGEVNLKVGLERSILKKGRVGKGGEISTNVCTDDLDLKPKSGFKLGKKAGLDLRSTPLREIMFPNDPDRSEEGDNLDSIYQISELSTEERARLLLESILSPANINAETFYDEYFERKPLLVQHSSSTKDGDRNNQNQHVDRHQSRFDGLLSIDNIRRDLVEKKLRYGCDINVTRYSDVGGGDKRKITLDPPPLDSNNNDNDGENNGHVMADPVDVWSNFDDAGCTIRLLRPHVTNDCLYSLLGMLEHEFGCMVGSNAYLTPAASQGFAPHYDNVGEM